MIYLRLVPHGLLEVALGEELGVDELGGLLRVGPVLGLRSIGPSRRWDGELARVSAYMFRAVLEWYL